MTPHATHDITSSQTNGDMSNDSAPLTNGETPRSRALSVCTRTAYLSSMSFYNTSQHNTTTTNSDHEDQSINGYRGFIILEDCVTLNAGVRSALV